jgi:hypothetical protein
MNLEQPLVGKVCKTWREFVTFEAPNLFLYMAFGIVASAFRGYHFALPGQAWKLCEHIGQLSAFKQRLSKYFTFWSCFLTHCLLSE